MTVTKEQVQAFETVRQSGITNMFFTPNVIEAADKICNVILTKDDCHYIMKNYGKLLKEYNIERR